MRSILMLGSAVLALAPAVAWANAPSPAADAPAADAPASDGAADGGTAGGGSSNAMPIVVTATPFGHTIDDTPTVSARVDADAISRAGGASIADALRDVPGVSSTGFASGASRPIIRGMDSNRVRLLEDGTSSSDVSDIGPDHGIPIDPLSARSIEVVRGAATLRYGSQAIGGVVNTINNRVPTTLPTEAISAEASTSYTTVNKGVETAALVDGKAGQLALHADGFWRTTDNYDTPLGTQQNSWFNGWGGSVGGSYFLPGDKSHVGLAVTHYDARYGIPSDTTYIDMRQTKVMTRNSFALDSGLLKTFTLDGSYGDYQHSEKNPDGSINTTFKNKEWNGRGELLLNAMGPVRNTALGVEYQHRDFSAVGEDSSYLNPATSQNIAGYLFTEIQLADPLHVEASGRVEHVRITGTPADDAFTVRKYTPVSGAIGVLYTPIKAVKFGLNFSSTGRAPALTELFARGAHDGPQTFETGDPNLKIERANSLEGSLRVRQGGFAFTGSVYYTWYKNYIYGELTGRTCDDDGVCTASPDGELRELFYRQQDAKFRGLEAEMSQELVKTDEGTFTAKVLGDYTRATLDNGSNVPRIPPYRIGGGLAWAGKTLDAGIMFSHYGRQDKAGDFDTPTAGYNNLNMNVAWRPFKSHPGIELAIVGQNLTDDTQRLATALNKDLVVMPGRSVRFVIKAATF
ncbi:iron complex outermembrane receptor protein [Novosphingobium capsulatum]|uniref:Iron complex outermembrane receptor protein n=1 Tax=Novosphingobium capsulatum TaxID=13688 RepID=A0ABU1ML13_9SPHN|nr:TonB-dependent receptor [Novosphingobium capsulatum]MDR6510607.1 iron complex outermembrane receptor protein [Novosphingobium capsulatum]